MRIAHLLSSADVAGGQLVALRLAQAARARGHDAWFVSPDEGPFATLARSEGFEVRLVDVSRTFRVDGMLRLARLLRRTRTDVLHTHTQLAANILGRVAARLAGARVVSHAHIESHFRPSRLARLYHGTLDNLTARLCIAVVAVSEDTRRALVEQGYPAGRVVVVYNGVDLDAAPASRPPGRRVAEVARLAPVKGQRELISALRLLPEASLVLAGEDLERGGAYRAELEAHAEALGVRDRVVFRGHDPRVTELLAEVDVVALPSTTEGLPMVLLEAMAHGKPVVATPVGGTAELVVDGETGILVPPGDVEGLAEALRRLLDDPALASRMGAAGRRRVEERFTADRMADRVLELYT